MKRCISIAISILITLTLITDIGLIIKYHQKPNVFSSFEHISFIHYFIFHSNGIEFSIFKTIFSVSLLSLWVWRSIHPNQVNLLGYATLIYSLLWTLIGALVLTGVSGILQLSAGLPINLLDLSLLTSSASRAQIASLLSVIILFPLALMTLPRLYNRL